MSGRSKFPFTATQWEELEHQALIYKYMAAGMPIPPDLLFTVRRSLDSSLISSKFFPYQTSPIGWNPYTMGYGKKLDPEPGRCRRTDGKKWRCSKEAYPDSKYCERHMHRGKNRSRKPVEILTTPAVTAPSGSNTSPSTISSITRNPSTAKPTTLHSLSSLPPPLPSDTSYDTNHQVLYPSSSSSRPPGMNLSTQDSSCHLLLESGYFRDRYLHGLKEEVGEHGFFHESSGTMRTISGSSIDEAWQLDPLKMGGGTALNQPKQSGCSGLQSRYPYLELKSETSEQEKQNLQQCDVWGRDFKCELSMKVERENHEPQKKTIHHFFDEWPPKGRDCWRDSPSTTQLSISIPTSSHDFFLSNSRNHNDG